MVNYLIMNDENELMRKDRKSTSLLKIVTVSLMNFKILFLLFAFVSIFKLADGQILLKTEEGKWKILDETTRAPRVEMSFEL